MPNRIFQITLMYDSVTSRFYMGYMGHISRLAQAMPGTRPSVLTSDAPYVEAATTNTVIAALNDPDWDYINFTERDNVIPDDWPSVVANELDPDVHKIVGRWYFGKVQEDMRSICGYIRPNGDFDRFSYNEVQHFRSHPGLYRVGAGQEGVDDSSLTFTVGLGCTAVHRSVFENWAGEMPWFKSEMGWNPNPSPGSPRGHLTMLGHDVNFCKQAYEQGIHVWVDTRKASGHIGLFVADDLTYTASAQHMIATGQVDADTLAGKEKLSEGVATAMTQDELAALARIAKGKTVLEIGSRYGASTIAMAGGGAERVYALDWHRGDVWHGEADGSGDTLDKFWRYCRKYKVQDRVVPLVGRSQDLLPLLPDQHFDLILVDGDHSYEGSRYDMEQAIRLVKPGGSIVLHDFDREKEFSHEGTAAEIGVTRAAREVLGEPSELIDTVAIYHR